MLAPEQLPTVAATALESGLESPALVSLASLSDDNPREARPLFSRALDELGIHMPSARDAVIDLSGKIASEILDESLAPYAGAKRIWELATRVAIEQVPELHPFVYAADEWETRPDDRSFFEESIIREARILAKR
jgi:hypothetical protein